MIYYYFSRLILKYTIECVYNLKKNLKLLQWRLAQAYRISITSFFFLLY